VSATAITGTAIAISGATPACGSVSTRASVSPYVMHKYTDESRYVVYDLS
jgi:hypothetical protein